MELQRLPANAGFLLPGILFAAAIIGRYGLPVPWRAMAAPAAVSPGVVLWFLLGRPSIAGRINAISIGAGIILLMVVRALLQPAKPSLLRQVCSWGTALLPAK